ncbi:MAG: hypothetical protein GTN69_02475 [Armatimonadetes bacterium]|nr:hypothetical protein [Armatimonadota bacterium]
MTNSKTWKIEIEWSENAAIDAVAKTGVTWDSFAGFTSLITALAHTAPITGAYDKTRVQITHLPSGERYDLRVDVTHPDSPDTSDNDLLERVKAMCLYMLRDNGANCRRYVKNDAEHLEQLSVWATWGERFLAAA